MNQQGRKGYEKGDGIRNMNISNNNIDDYNKEDEYDELQEEFVQWRKDYMDNKDDAWITEGDKDKNQNKDDNITEKRKKPRMQSKSQERNQKNDKIDQVKQDQEFRNKWLGDTGNELEVMKRQIEGKKSGYLQGENNEEQLNEGQQRIDQYQQGQQQQENNKDGIRGMNIRGKDVKKSLYAPKYDQVPLQQQPYRIKGLKLQKQIDESLSPKQKEVIERIYREESKTFQKKLRMRENILGERRNNIEKVLDATELLDSSVKLASTTKQNQLENIFGSEDDQYEEIEEIDEQENEVMKDGDGKQIQEKDKEKENKKEEQQQDGEYELDQQQEQTKEDDYLDQQQQIDNEQDGVLVIQGQIIDGEDYNQGDKRQGSIGRPRPNQNVNMNVNMNRENQQNNNEQLEGEAQIGEEFREQNVTHSRIKAIYEMSLRHGRNTQTLHLHPVFPHYTELSQTQRASTSETMKRMNLYGPKTDRYYLDPISKNAGTLKQAKVIDRLYPQQLLIPTAQLLLHKPPTLDSSNTLTRSSIRTSNGSRQSNRGMNSLRYEHVEYENIQGINQNEVNKEEKQELNVSVSRDKDRNTIKTNDKQIIKDKKGNKASTDELKINGAVVLRRQTSKDWKSKLGKAAFGQDLKKQIRAQIASQSYSRSLMTMGPEDIDEVVGKT
ncbi:MAG: hypothetical protein EZS28_024913 [Streblomastix strix]|uniref:Uncharacterized protein n=1 Tax=Streblomastix strix TaxID=222440 RepID=A0A5J4VAH6_9EUKA|nr:MAG: hypothetical protein EZS28_024913 [Streblomastix strix]